MGRKLAFYCPCSLFGEHDSDEHQLLLVFNVFSGYYSVFQSDTVGKVLSQGRTNICSSTDWHVVLMLLICVVVVVVVEGFVCVCVGFNIPLPTSWLLWGVLHRVNTISS